MEVGTNTDNLTPISPEVISNQATINIGTIGHVAHGKSTLVKALTGVDTVRFKTEKERGATIHLGYANGKIYKCDTCPRPLCYKAFGSNQKANSFKCKNPNCRGTMTLERHVSFVDTPGHDCLMATMINGTSVMDTALLIIGGNQDCPQPQTQEHLAAAEIMQLQNIGIIQNKVDLLPDRETARENYRQIKDFVKGTVAEKSPIIPVSSVMKQNIDAVCDYICNQIPLPEHDFSAPARMIIVRSFDINKPGIDISELKGGVPGGTLIQGILRVGQEVEIRPGVVKRLPNGQVTSCQPLRTIVKSLYAEKNKLEFAVPGGLIGVGTSLDPSLTKKDFLKGQVIGHPGTLPDILIGLEISYFLMKRLIGSDDQDKNSKPIKVAKMTKDEILMINVGSISSKVKVTAIKGDLAKFRLQDPICSPIGEKIAISRRIDEKWRLIGWGKIMAGTPVPV